jgi:hypothetical protein
MQSEVISADERTCLRSEIEILAILVSVFAASRCAASQPPLSWISS